MDVCRGLVELLRSSYDTWKVFPTTSFETSLAADAIATMIKLVDSYDCNNTLCTSISSTFPEDCDRDGLENVPIAFIDRTEAIIPGRFSDMRNSDSEFVMFDWVRYALDFSQHQSTQLNVLR